VVVLDPPAFIKRKRDFKAGLQGYRAVNRLAMPLLSRDGIFVSCSCSHHLPEDALQRTVLETARHLDRSVQVLLRGHQSPDHPAHAAIPENEYLKVLFTRVLPG
jgi:23S rRNA (cytosine1962-C5)-methyltransferase